MSVNLSPPAGFLEVVGARENNLKEVHVRIPHQQLTVLTGVSGCGKSSLLFNVIYAEAHRRFMETLDTNYVHNFIDLLERPDVDQLFGLQSVIGIKQERSAIRSPRSTVGTMTELSSLLRLLFARAGNAYSMHSGELLIQQAESEILESLWDHYADQEVQLLAPLVRGRKGHYQELFRTLIRQGFTTARIDGKPRRLREGMRLDRYQVHFVEVVVWKGLAHSRETLEKMAKATLQMGKGTLLVDAGKKCRYFSQQLMDPATGLSYELPSPNSFSFNSPQGACPGCEGLGEIEVLDEQLLLPDMSLSLYNGGLAPLGPLRKGDLFDEVKQSLKHLKYTVQTPLSEMSQQARNLLLYGEETAPDRLASLQGSGLAGYLLSRHKEALSAYTQWVVCPVCEGTRLRKEALGFKVDGKNIAELSMMSLEVLYSWLEGLEERLSARQRKIAEELLKELRSRLGLILDIGLHYLDLHRPLHTLSGGETQRLRLASQIGSQLTGVMYILDEPSIGLHQRDNGKLIAALQKLRDLGNTVLVIEHDKETMLAADHLIEIGPGAGQRGGRITAEGPPALFLQLPGITADYLSGRRHIAIPATRRPGHGTHLVIEDCHGRNLKHVRLSLPLGKLITLTGVSGSGKSSLAYHTLLPVLKRHFGLQSPAPLPHGAVHGLEHIDKVIEIDQSPIGRTVRSTPATYTQLHGLVRSLFAQLPEAKARGYKAGRFSFNVKGGRCEVCQGAGIRLIEMDFLPSIRIPCEGCHGRRYDRETLEVKYRGKSMADILAMTVEEATAFFEHHPQIHKKLYTMAEIGLGYITLGQHTTTLSGGEAQRIKLAAELARKGTGRTLYLLDEPTTGLHFQDIDLLLGVLHRLTDQGNTVLVIEHNLDIIKASDHVIDIGKEGGEKGGQVMVEGPPEQVAGDSASYLAPYLQAELGWI